MIKCIVLAVVLYLGVYFMMNPDGLQLGRQGAAREGFGAPQSPPQRCPNLLIQRGSDLLLFNTRVNRVPGVNPIRFESLDDYGIFTEWQRSQGIRCPVLFLQHSYDTQGKPVYKVRKSPYNLQGGLEDHIVGGTPSPMQSKLYDAGRDDPPYNQHSYPAYDPLDQYIGLDTPLDKMFHDNEQAYSPNPMDSNWGGPNYTNKLVKAGYYKGSDVSLLAPQE